MVWFYKISWIQTFLQPPTKSRPHGLSDTLKVHFHFLWIPLSLFYNLSQNVAHLDSLKFTFTFPQHPTFVFPQPPTKNRPPGLSDAPKVHRGEAHSTCFSPSSPPPELKRKYWRKTFGLTFETGCDSCGTGIPFCQLSMPSTLCQKPLGRNIDISRSKNSTKNLLFKAWMMEHTSTHIYKSIVAFASYSVLRT